MEFWLERNEIYMHGTLFYFILNTSFYCTLIFFFYECKHDLSLHFKRIENIREVASIPYILSSRIVHVSLKLHPMLSMLQSKKNYFFLLWTIKILHIFIKFYNNYLKVISNSYFFIKKNKRFTLQLCWHFNPCWSNVQ